MRLRIKDVDFGYKQITVRDGKGNKERITMLPEIIIDPLRRNLDMIYTHVLNRGGKGVQSPGDTLFQG